ncbi:unnamed protein product [Vitrella brassicaformis CCMP3155]|uniref:Lipase maturation factor n=3 Tax=Vitrella brassicaformis TaxID=1169539 RepID=A0A0G4F8F5_VITBC|nr:unnamed protein product [Vitrella brassicaformis CCMP3155]|eukprot:CEM08662.1 unnamed protein product [Vitrella brassicaformis CCMP3155]
MRPHQFSSVAAALPLWLIYVASLRPSSPVLSSFAIGPLPAALSSKRLPTFHPSHSCCNGRRGLAAPWVMMDDERGGEDSVLTFHSPPRDSSILPPSESLPDGTTGNKAASPNATAAVSATREEPYPDENENGSRGRTFPLHRLAKLVRARRKKLAHDTTKTAVRPSRPLHSYLTPRVGRSFLRSFLVLGALFPFSGLLARLWGAKWVAGAPPLHHTFYLSRFLFFRLLGVTAAGAFLSIAAQGNSLFGPQGIQPLSRGIAEIRRQYRLLSVKDKLRELPYGLTAMIWGEGSRGRVRGVMALGVLAAVMSVCHWGGPVQPLLLATLYSLYFAVIQAGDSFLTYQWDVLLCESLLLATIAAIPSPNWLAHRLSMLPLQLLAFRLMFMSGVAKLASADPTWSNLTALDYHFQTQPLPKPAAARLHRMPRAVLRFGTAQTLAVEVLAPFLLLWPFSYARTIGFVLQLILQLGIMYAGHFGFFNFLTIALLTTTLDDATLMPLANACRDALASTPLAQLSLPAVGQWLQSQIGTSALSMKRLALSSAPFGLVATLIAGVYCLTMTRALRLGGGMGMLRSWRSVVGSFLVGSPYGLFASMTTRRQEIILEGSADGQTWWEFHHRYKPDAIDKAPKPLAPLHMPRVDWNFWFLPLQGGVASSPWFFSLVRLILEGSPDVYRIFTRSTRRAADTDEWTAAVGSKNDTSRELLPFSPAEPPKYVRGKLYTYEFSGGAGGGEGGGEWEEGRHWRRRLDGVYLPPVALRP